MTKNKTTSTCYPTKLSSQTNLRLSRGDGVKNTKKSVTHI